MKGVGVGVGVTVGDVLSTGVNVSGVTTTGDITVASVTFISGVGKRVMTSVPDCLLVSVCPWQLVEASRINPLSNNR